MTKCYDGHQYREMTAEELQQQQDAIELSTKIYWQNIPYDVAVDNEIRKLYSVSQEFAILRQKDEKPEEYKTYYDYCESCKAYVREQKSIYIIE